MSNQIRINYEAVYSKTAELCRQLESEVREMEAGYRQTSLPLHGMNSRTNMVFMEAMEENQVLLDDN